MEDFRQYLEADDFIDSTHPAIVRYAREEGGEGGEDDESARQVAVRFYAAIRDGFRYNPWNLSFDPSAYRASAFLARGVAKGGHCIDKAILLAACARARGIPARLRFANVRNHIGTEEIERRLGTDLLVFHGYTELYFGGHWIAATPAFNKELCDHLGVDPLEFDGVTDAVFQSNDRAGGLFMEYVHDYGSFATLPFDLMIAEWRKHYPVLRDATTASPWQGEDRDDARHSSPRDPL